MEKFLHEKAKWIGEDVKIKGTNYLFRVEEFFLEEKDEYFRTKKKRILCEIK